MDWLHANRFLPLVSESVIHELADVKNLDPEAENREMAHDILSCLATWICLTPKLAPLQNGIAEQVADKIMARTALLRNATLIIAEAAVHGCDLLITNDPAIIAAEKQDHFKLILLESDYSDVFIVSPGDLISYLRSKPK